MAEQLDLIADASRLRILADWFDAQDASARSLGVPTSDDVQRDLRRIAEYLASDDRHPTAPGPAVAEPTTRPDIVEQAAKVIWNRLGRGDWDRVDEWRRKEFILAATTLAEAGLLADPEQIEWTLGRVRKALGTPDGRAVSVHAAEVRAEVDRLRARIHEAVDETQRRYAKYQKECDDHRNTYELAKEWYLERTGTDFGMGSLAGRTFVVELIEQRDLALWLHAEAEWRRVRSADAFEVALRERTADMKYFQLHVRDVGDLLNNTQARIDAALAKLDAYDGYGAGMMFHDELRAALQGDQPAESGGSETGGNAAEPEVDRG